MSTIIIASLQARKLEHREAESLALDSKLELGFEPKHVAVASVTMISAFHCP